MCGVALDRLKNKRQDFINQSQALQVEINAIYDENKEALRLKDLNVRRGRVVGRISLWLESVVISDNMANHRTKLAEIESRINEINSKLDINEIEERKQSIINRISTLMYQWAKNLDLEHSEFPYRFDFVNITLHNFLKKNEFFGSPPKFTKRSGVNFGGDPVA